MAAKYIVILLPERCYSIERLPPLMATLMVIVFVLSEENLNATDFDGIIKHNAIRFAKHARFYRKDGSYCFLFDFT